MCQVCQESMNKDTKAFGLKHYFIPRDDLVDYCMLCGDTFGVGNHFEQKSGSPFTLPQPKHAFKDQLVNGQLICSDCGENSFAQVHQVTPEQEHEFVTVSGSRCDLCGVSRTSHGRYVKRQEIEDVMAGKHIYIEGAVPGLCKFCSRSLLEGSHVLAPRNSGTITVPGGLSYDRFFNRYGFYPDLAENLWDEMDALQQFDWMARRYESALLIKQLEKDVTEQPELVYYKAKRYVPTSEGNNDFPNAEEAAKFLYERYKTLKVQYQELFSIYQSLMKIVKQTVRKPRKFYQIPRKVGGEE